MDRIETFVGITMAATPAHGSATFTVNLPGDTRDANTGDGKCDVNLPGTGEQCTLRATRPGRPL